MLGLDKVDFGDGGASSLVCLKPPSRPKKKKKKINGLRTKPKLAHELIDDA